MFSWVFRYGLLSFFFTSIVSSTTCSFTADTNGGLGTCTTTLNSGVTCAPTCNSGYYGTGSVTCNAGNLSSTFSCIQCTPGEYQTSGLFTGTTCNPCSQGSVTNTLAGNGATSCTQCIAGQFSADSKVACQTCHPGSVTNTFAGNGATSCTQCIAGQFSADSKIACQACDAGKYSRRGSEACLGAEVLPEDKSLYYPSNLVIETDADRAVLTLSGCMSSSNLQKGDCIDASATGFDASGLYVETSTDACFKHKTITRKLQITFSEPQKMFSVKMNVSGYNIVAEKLYIRTASFRNAIDRSKFTSASLIETSNDCDQISEYLDVDGTSPGNKDGDQVIESKPTTWKCRPCPYGAGCNGVELWKDVRAKYGFWRFLEQEGDPRSTAFIECPRHEACLGSKNDDPNFAIVGQPHKWYDSAEGCNEKLGYRAKCDGKICPLCSVCAPGYYAVSFARCEKCPSLGEATFFLGFAAIFAAGLIAFMTYSAINQSINKAGEEVVSNADVMKRIIINYFQVISLASNFPVEWPGLLRSLFTSSGFLSSIGENMFRFECTFPSMNKADVFYLRLVVFALIPFGVVFILLLYWKFHSFFTNSPWTGRTEEYPVTSKDKFVIGAVSTLYLLYPYSCEMAFSAILSCRNIGDKSYLEADMSEPCYEGTHNTFLIVFGVIQIFIYVVGLPAAIWYFLWKNRARLDDYVVKLRWGLFYRGYRRPRYYWEVIVMFRKSLIVLISMMSVQDISLQAGLAVIAVQLFLLLHIKLEPYALEKDTKVLSKMEFSGLVCAFVCMWAGMVNFGKIGGNNENSALAIMVTAFTFALNFVFIFWSLKLYFSQFLKDHDYFEKYTSRVPKPIRNMFLFLYKRYCACLAALWKIKRAVLREGENKIGEHEDWHRVFSVEHQQFYFIHDASKTVMWEFYDESEQDEISKEGRLYPREHEWKRYWDPSRSRTLRTQRGISRWYFHHEVKGTKWSAAKGESSKQTFTNPLANIKPLRAFKKLASRTRNTVDSIQTRVKRHFSTDVRNPALEIEVTQAKEPGQAVLHQAPKQPAANDMWKRQFDAEEGSYYYQNKRGSIKWEDPLTGQDVENDAPAEGWRLYSDESSVREYFYHEDTQCSFWVFSV